MWPLAQHRFGVVESSFPEGIVDTILGAALPLPLLALLGENLVSIKGCSEDRL